MTSMERIEVSIVERTTNLRVRDGKRVNTAGLDIAELNGVRAKKERARHLASCTSYGKVVL